VTNANRLASSARSPPTSAIMSRGGVVHGGLYGTAIETFTTIGAFAAVGDRRRQAVGVTNVTEGARKCCEGGEAPPRCEYRRGRERIAGSSEELGGFATTSRCRAPHVVDPDGSGVGVIPTIGRWEERSIRRGSLS
jgi:hypothetical protein